MSTVGVSESAALGVATSPAGLPARPTVDPRSLAADRLARLQQGIARAGLDAVLLTAPESVAYATGYLSVGSTIFRTWRGATLVTAEAAWLVVPAADVPAAVDAGVAVERIAPHGRFFFEALQPGPETEVADRHPNLAGALEQAARDAGLLTGAAARIGVEELAAHADLAGMLGAHRAAVEDATALVSAVRAIKDTTEVALLRYAAGLAEAGVDAALAAAGEGVTEAELVAIIAATMAAGGGQPRFVVATVGPRSALADAGPTHRGWRRGELARFDVGCIVDGYWSDIGRTAVLGEPDDLQASRYAAILAGEQAQLEQARPGMTAGQVFDLAVKTVQAYGLTPYRRHHCGHGIGMSVYEPPIVSPGVEGVLRPGMTFCFETPFYEVGWGGMMVEDLVVVTEDGVDVLTTSDRSLRVVGA